MGDAVGVKTDTRDVTKQNRYSAKIQEKLGFALVMQNIDPFQGIEAEIISVVRITSSSLSNRET